MYQYTQYQLYWTLLTNSHKRLNLHKKLIFREEYN